MVQSPGFAVTRQASSRATCESPRSHDEEPLQSQTQRLIATSGVPPHYPGSKQMRFLTRIVTTEDVAK